MSKKLWHNALFILFLGIAVRCIWYFTVPHYVSQAKRLIHNHTIQQALGSENCFGFININSGVLAAMPCADNLGQTSVSSSKGGSIVAVSSITPGTCTAHILLKDGSVPDRRKMAALLCHECVDEYSVSPYDLLLMEISTGKLYILDFERFTSRSATVFLERKEDSLELIMKKGKP